MRTQLAEQFGIDYPIFGFTPSQHVAAAISRAGGLGVLGCVRFNEAEELDEGNPNELGLQYRELRDALPAVSVLGGCCGTDHRHVAEICSAWMAPG